MNVEQYIEHCRTEIRRTFEKSQARQPDERLKYRVEGLIQALRLLGLMTDNEINLMMEDEHQQVFGESIADRQARNQKLAKIKATSPDKYLDIPTVERKP